MNLFKVCKRGSALLFMFSFVPAIAYANAYRPAGQVAELGKSGLSVTPHRDWNRLDVKPGKYAEIWTLDGEQLNDVTFYHGVASGDPIVRERDKKRNPLPKFKTSTLLVEIPEILEGTYRAYKQIGSFNLLSANPAPFLGQSGVIFTYEFVDSDDLPRKGEARAMIYNKKLFMVTFDAPRLHYFDRTVSDFRLLADSAKLSK